MSNATRRAAGRVTLMLGCLLGWACVQAGEGREVNNVVVVLDASGSMESRMGGSSLRRIDAAKQALKEVMKQLPADTHVGLLVFSGKNISNEWVYPLGPRDDARLTAAIDLPQPDGGTPLGDSIKKGADRLLEVRARQFGYGTYRLLIVTDGEANDGHLVEKYTPDVLSRGITVDVIGVDMKGSHTLATKANSYRRADDPEALKRAISEVFAEVADGGGDGATGEDAFSAIAPLPNGLAGAMVQALVNSGNHPIGGAPRPVGTVAGEAQNGDTPGAPSGSSPAQTTTAPEKPRSTFFYVAIALVAWIFLKAVFGKKSKKKR